MDETRWLRRLVDACRAAKDRLRESPRARRRELDEPFDDLCARLERKLEAVAREREAA
jgi:hypothetical protein